MGTRVISAALTLKDRDFSSNLKKASEKVDDLGRGVSYVGNKVKSFSSEVGTSLKSLAKTASKVSFAALATGAAALTVGVGKNILEMDQSFARVQAQTGAMGTDLAVLESAAKQAFKQGYGESLGEVASAVALVKQNMKGLGNDEIESVTSKALLLADVFEGDVSEVTRGVNNTMEAFGVSSDKAFDLFTAGGQRGLNFSKEMFDNVAEYAPLFGKMGYSAEEYFGILERGAQAGVYNLDYVNDVMKEFQIKIKDGSKGTSDAMAGLSKDTQNVWNEFYKGNGTVAGVASAVIDELKGMDDQVAANQIAVGLFGTKFEDLEADAVYAMLGSTEAMKDFEGSTDKAAQAVTSTFGSKVSQVWRDLKMSISDLANSSGGKEFLDSLATAAENMVPKIIGLATSAIGFANSIRDNWNPIKDTLFALGAGIASFVLVMGTMKVVSTISMLMNAFKTATVASTVAQLGLTAATLASPMTWLALGLAAVVAAGVLVYRNFDTIKAKAIELWTKIKENPFVQLVTNLSPVKGAVDAISKGFDLAKSTFDKLKSAISNFKLPDWVTSIGSTLSTAKDKVSSGINAIKNKLPSFAVGTNNVSQDMTANIHKGEMIIPARQAENLRNAGLNIDNIDSVKGGTSTPSVENNSSTKNNNITININGTNSSTNQIINELVPKLKLAMSNM